MIDGAYVQRMARYNRWQNQNLYGVADTLSDDERRRETRRLFRLDPSDAEPSVVGRPHADEPISPTCRSLRPASRTRARFTPIGMD